ncbi:MAG TPA: hypothetical protein DCW74_00585 [Alteromonas australica]|uniref:Uncharacterized protein n=1 Tax=Alteromonas australica TaxID=589873 RepID=A0A350NYU8_9ALTE|nr:hypothetical protein [Alteromonas australica]
MGAFNTAWLVLKNKRKLRQIGEGGFRGVYEGDNKNEVIKVPRRRTYEGDLSHNALMNAFAQLGYPVEPEKPQILPPHKAINSVGTAGGLAMDPVIVRPFNTLGYTQRRADIVDKNKIADMMDERERDIGDDLRGKEGYNFYGRTDLRDYTSPAVFSINDLKPRNLGVYDDNIKAIDAGTVRPKKILNHDFNSLSARLAHLPETERRSLVNLFSDKSQFQDIGDFDFSRDNALSVGERQRMKESNPIKLRDLGYKISTADGVYQTPMEQAHDAYAAYLEDVRAMQFANSMVEDPYQTKLNEFVDPNTESGSQSSLREQAIAGQIGMDRRKLIERQTGNADVGATHTYPGYPGLETLFPPPAPKVEPPPQPYVPMNQYTKTASTRGGPAAGA